jgi:hypothetical protein
MLVTAARVEALYALLNAAGWDRVIFGFRFVDRKGGLLRSRNEMVFVKQNLGVCPEWLGKREPYRTLYAQDYVSCLGNQGLRNPSHSYYISRCTRGRHGLLIAVLKNYCSFPVDKLPHLP